VVRFVDNFVEQVIVTLPQQLIVFRQVRRTEATSYISTQVCMNTLAVSQVMNPLHVGDAYVSRDTTTARKMACRPGRPLSFCGAAVHEAHDDIYNRFTTYWSSTTLAW